MVTGRSLEIHTVIVRGDFESFRAAFTRSVLGVTFKKFKRRGRQFYQHRIHNEKVTHSICRFLHEYLLEKTHSISNYQLKTDLNLHWDDTGKILGISDIRVALFIKTAELKVDQINVQQRLESIVIDMFYSDIDVGSQKLRNRIHEIMDSLGNDNFEYHEWNLLDNKGKEIAEKYGVKLAPTIIINVNPKLIMENPDERSLQNEIEDLYVPYIEESNPRFERNEEAKASLQHLFVMPDLKGKSS